MPTTYNGIGTRYAGRRNEERREAACHSCGRLVNLTSYDTRLWFVILFIPVIPLARKRILDECPVCRRHYAIDAEKWETQKQLGISGAMDTYEASPTPEAAMELHQTMLNFHQRAQAAEFRRGMVEKFGENAHVRAYLGEALTRVGNAAEGAPHFARALELRPDLPEARVGVARQHLGAQRLDDARGLLDFLEKPGAEHLYSLEPLEILADAYRAAGQHAPALELYQRLLAGLPAIGQVPAFRKKVQLSEKALRPAATMLPKRKRSLKNLWRSAGGLLRAAGFVGLILLLIGAGFIIANEYNRRHRTIYVINATDADTSVIVRGAGEDQTVRLARMRPGDAKPNMQEIVLPEGHYHVLIGGEKTEEFDWDVRTEYWDRWGGKNVWLLNVRGAALLLSEHVTYRRDPPPPTFELHFGRTAEALSGITNPFTVLPASLQMKSGEERVLTRLDFFPGEPSGLLGALALQHREAEAFDLAEWMLRRNAADETMLQNYVALAAQAHQTPRAERLLRTGLAVRPVNIPWHREYQNLHMNRADEAALAAEYDGLLAAQPENSALLYLRGRIGPDGGAFFERAHRADPMNPYANFALGYDRLAMADAAGARPLLESALAALPESVQFAQLLWQCRLALGETAALEAEARAAIAREPLAIGASQRLIDALAAQGKNADALKIAASYARAAAQLPPEERTQLHATVRRHALYATGDFAALEKDAAPDRTPAGRRALLQALIEQGRAAEAVKLQPLTAANVEDALHCLLVSLALRQAGDAATADAWLERGVQLLSASSKAEQNFARILRDSAPPNPAELAALKTDTMGKAIVLATLAAQHPEQRAELHALVRKLPLARTYPYHFLQRLTAAEK